MSNKKVKKTKEQVEEEFFILELKRLGVYADLQEVCIEYGVYDLARIRRQDRRVHIVRARHAAMVFLREYFNWSYPVIGELFGRDHTTVMHAVNKAKEKTKVKK